MASKNQSKLMKNIFKGTGVALITPFKDTGEIDFESLSRLVKYCIEEGVDFLVTLGTTAESATLSEREKEAVVRFIIKENNAVLPVLMGIGGNNTKLVCSTLKSIPKGVDGVLCVTPYYNKPTQNGVYEHFKEISRVSEFPIVLYNVPGRTATNMSSTTILNLANNFENIVAIKEASGDLEQVMEVIRASPDGFDVLSGDDNLTFSMIALGAKGVISVSGQSFPKLLRDMVDSALAGRFSHARSIHYKLFEYTQLLFAEGNPGGVKAALAYIGISKSNLRLPLWKISDATTDLINAKIDEIRDSKD